MKCNKIKCFYFFPRALLTIIFKHVCLAGRRALFTPRGFIRHVFLLFQCMNFGFILLKISTWQMCWSRTASKHCLWRANLPLRGTQLWTYNVVIITTHQCNNTRSSSDYANFKMTSEDVKDNKKLLAFSFPHLSVRIIINQLVVYQSIQRFNRTLWRNIQQHRNQEACFDNLSKHV